MLQTEKSDLDFGIYRVVGRRRGDMEDFITKTIPGAVNKAVADAQPHNATVKEKEELEHQIRRDFGENAFTPDDKLRPQFADGELGKKWHEVCARASGAQLLTDQDVCNRLLQFFGRYYHEGDFVSKRRHAGNAKYAVPYDGREVLLHWANRDQYYVKTADRFAQYAFTADKSAFQFRVEKTAAQQKDNNKPPKGEFILADARKENERVIAIFHRRELSEEEENDIKALAKNGGDQQAKIITLAEKKIKDGEFPLLAPLLASHAVQKEKSRFAVHAARFVRRNTSDYFIHRNLRAFLRRELDFFLKNETINADELAENALAQNRIAAFRAVRNVARQVIDMLAQWEDFQKALWEKKKFILQTEYCATLGHIPNWKNCSILKDIADCKEQWEEWKDLGMCGEFSDLFPANKQEKHEERIAFLHKNPSLPVDTVHFPPEFKDCLLDYFKGKDNIPSIDDATDGILFHGDNWQALNLLQEKFRGRVQCVYIDPPYNTDESKIIYKNDYEHSSWLSLIASRYDLTRSLAALDAVIMTAIDDYEMSRLCMLSDQCFPMCARHVVVVNHHPQGSGMGNAILSRTHEYMVVLTFPDAPPLKGGRVNENLEQRSFRRAGRGGNNFRMESSNSFYAILVDPKTRKVVGIERPPIGDYPKDDSPEGFRRIYPIGKDNSERVWRLAYESGLREFRAGNLECTNRWVIRITIDHGDNRRAALFTNWTDSCYNAGVHGENLLSDILGKSGLFSYPKSIYTVMDAVESATYNRKNAVILDYFAGSGTTAHAVIHLNREDDGGRKFILAEMGDYFDTVLLKRVKKIIYAPEWIDGKPSRLITTEEHKQGPRLVKYHRIESYEDALDNVDFGADKAMRKLDDFIPRYMLRWESRNNPTFLSDTGLENPFDYKLQLSGETARTERADLPETFAYLIGLRIQTRRVLTDEGGRNKSRYVVYRGECGGEDSAVIWRDVSGWTEANYKRDREFVESAGLASGAKRIYVNRESLIDGAEILDPLFRERMFPAEAADLE